MVILCCSALVGASGNRMNCEGDLERMAENEWVGLERSKGIWVAQEGTLKYQTMDQGWTKSRTVIRGH